MEDPHPDYHTVSERTGTPSCRIPLLGLDLVEEREGGLAGMLYVLG